jgi:hypothetical protein
MASSSRVTWQNHAGTWSVHYDPARQRWVLYKFDPDTEEWLRVSSHGSRDDAIRAAAS